MKISASIYEMELNNMYFKDNAKRREYTDALNNVKTNSMPYLFYIVPLFDRMFYWTEKTEYGKVVTISLVLYMLDDMRAYLRMMNDLIDADDDLVDNQKDKLRSIVHMVQVEMDNYFKKNIAGITEKFEDNILYKTAEGLDPRFALRRLDLYKVLLEFYDNRITSMVLPIVDQDELIPTVGAFGVPHRAEKSAQEKQKEAYEDELRNYIAVLIKEQKYDSITKEFNIDLHKYRCDTDPLLWWKEHQQKFPLLFKVAKKILEIPAQSAASERFFSGLGRLICKARSSIHRELAGEMVTSYMRENRKNYKSETHKGFPPFGKMWEDRISLNHEDENVNDYDGLDLNNIDRNNDDLRQLEEDAENVAQQVASEALNDEVEEEIVQDVIYAAQRSSRAARVNYNDLHRGRT
jgi:hypothetical protein